MRRRERKTLETLMGIRNERERSVSSCSGRHNLSSSITIHHDPFLERQRQRTTPDVLNTSEFVREALKDAVSDFEQCLEGTINRIRSRSKDSPQFDFSHFAAVGSSSTPLTGGSSALGRSHTFPRHFTFSPGVIGDESSLARPVSNSSISSISTSSSAVIGFSPEAILAGLPSSVPPRAGDHVETESLASVNSDMSVATLRNIREQIAKSLSKMKDYEKQVEAIPVLKVQLSVLKEEKRLLMLQLKQRELQMRREVGWAAADDDRFLDDFGSDDEDVIDGVLQQQQQQGRDQIRFMTDRDIKKRYEDLRRARSESPYAAGARQLTVNPEEFISVQRQRSTSCGYNSEDSEAAVGLSPAMNQRKMARATGSGMTRTGTHNNLSNVHLADRPAAIVKPVVVEKATNTDVPEPTPVVELKPTKESPTIRKRDKSINTDPPPKSPPPVRKISLGVNTQPPRLMVKSTVTTLSMQDMFTKDELESRIQEAVFKTEEDIMSCPLLQKAMARVEAEALNAGSLLEESSSAVSSSAVAKETFEQSCQVGEENLRPFVINVGLQCKLEGDMAVCRECLNQFTPAAASGTTTDRFLNAVGANGSPHRVMTRSVGVGECKLIEDRQSPTQYRDVGICTEKWVEVIKASKQTDTEDFAFKDTPSPRVADMVFEPSPERVVLQRRSSLRKSTTSSPSPSRKSSAVSKTSATQTLSASTPTKTQATMTDAESKRKVSTKDAKVGGSLIQTRSIEVATTETLQRPKTLIKPGPVLCDKCSCNVDSPITAGNLSNIPTPSSPGGHKHAPPSPDFPWLSKIPRPVPENPDVQRIKSATSTGNLFIESGGNSKSPAAGQMQRSKSTLTPTLTRSVLSPKGSPLSPTNARRDVGTPPPHPTGRRVSSPLTRSYSPYSSSPVPSAPGDKKSLIPKLSLGNLNNSGRTSQASSGPVSPASAETRSLIPRVVTPPALRKLYPKPSDGEDKLAMKDRNVVRKTTYTKATAGVSNPTLEDATKKAASAAAKPSADDSSEDEGNKTDEEYGKKKSLASAGFPLPGAALFTPIDVNRTKAEPSKEMKAALKVLNDSLKAGHLRSSAQITNAVNIIQQEWFKTSSTKQSNPLDVEDYLDAIEDISKELLERVVNLTDVNGNTSLHYSVSHGNFDVVSVLLDSKVANPNIMNKAGYTCIMLISLAQIANSTHRAVVSRLFSLGDVNIRATQHGQTALMLAVSHGRLDMVQLLIEAGADVNIRDEDGSTALMCAAEHGHMEIVKYLLQHPDIDVLAKDNDGLTALAVAMEAGHRDVGVVLYASTSLSRGSSPYSSMRVHRRPASSASRGSTPPGKTPPPSSTTSGMTSKSPIGPTPPLRTRRSSVDKI